MAKATTERVAVWLTPDQVAWLKTKENVSATLRALVNEAMNMQRLAESLKQQGARKTGSAKPALVKAEKAEKTKPEKLKAVPPLAKPAMPAGRVSGRSNAAKAKSRSTSSRKPTGEGS